MMRHRRPRHGVILAIVLLVLLIVMLLGAQMVRSVTVQRQQARRHEQNLQSLWLAESGLQRATHQCLARPDYEGETWEVSSEALGAAAGGLVRIEVDVPPDPAARRRISVTATYPASGPYQVSTHREHTIDLSDSGGSS